MQRFRAAFCIVCRKHTIQKTVSGSNLLPSAVHLKEAFPLPFKASLLFISIGEKDIRLRPCRDVKNVHPRTLLNTGFFYRDVVRAACRLVQGSVSERFLRGKGKTQQVFDERR